MNNPKNIRRNWSVTFKTSFAVDFNAEERYSRFATFEKFEGKVNVGSFEDDIVNVPLHRPARPHSSSSASETDIER